MAIDLEVENNAEISAASTIEVEVDNRAVAVVDTTDDLTVEINRKEYSIVGDELYIPKRYEDAPAWLQNLIDETIRVALESERGDLLGTIDSLQQFLKEFEVAKNTYTQSIISSNDIDSRITTAITTLNSSLAASDASILNIAQTAVTPDQARATVLNAIRAELENTENGSLGAAIGSLQEAIATESEARAISIDTLTSTLEGVDGSVYANATATSALETYVGILDGEPTGTGLLANVEILQKQNDGVIETYTGTYDVITDNNADGDNNTINPDDIGLDSEQYPYSMWKVNSSTAVPTYTSKTINGEVYPLHKGTLHIKTDAVNGDAYYEYNNNALNNDLLEWYLISYDEFQTKKEALRSAHVGDVYIKYSSSAGGYKNYERAYKFIKTAVDETSPYSTDMEGYTWSIIVDTDAQNAYVTALNAYDLADDKRRVFTDTPTAPYDTGDLWIDSSSSYRVIKQYDGNSWIIADEQAAEFADEINPKVTTLQNQIDGKIEYYFYDNPTNHPLEDIGSGWGEAENGNVVYYEDTDEAYWYSSTIDDFIEIDDTSIYSALKVARTTKDALNDVVVSYYAWDQTTAPDTKYKWFKDDNTLWEHNGTTWVAVVVKKDDTLTAYDDVEKDTTLYVYNESSNGGSWVAVTPKGIVANAKAVTDLDIALSDLDKNVFGESGLEQTLTGTIEGGLATVESKFEYGSIIGVDGVYYNSGFGLVSTATGGNGNIDNPYDSEFWVNAEKFKFTNSAQSGQVAPFTIDASGTSPQITFNGRVSFNSVTDLPEVTYSDTVPGTDMNGYTLSGIGQHYLVLYNMSLTTGSDASIKINGVTFAIVGELPANTSTVIALPAITNESTEYSIELYTENTKNDLHLRLLHDNTEGEEWVNTVTNISYKVSNGIFKPYRDVGATSPENTVAAINAGTTTTVDGGRITTESITANQIDVNSVTADRLVAGTSSSTVWTGGGLVSENFNGNPYGDIGTPTSGFRLSSGAAGTSTDPNIYGAYIKGAVVSSLYAASTSEGKFGKLGYTKKGSTVSIAMPDYSTGFLENRVTSQTDSTAMVIGRRTFSVPSTHNTATATSVLQVSINNAAYVTIESQTTTIDINDIAVVVITTDGGVGNGAGYPFIATAGTHVFTHIVDLSSYDPTDLVTFRVVDGDVSLILNNG